MEKESALYQLMGVRMNGVMNGITNSDGDYQEIIRKSDEYSSRREELKLPEKIRLLIDRYVSEQNALGSRYGMLATCSAFPTVKRCFWENAYPQEQKKRFQKYNPHVQNHGKGDYPKVDLLTNSIF